VKLKVLFATTLVSAAGAVAIASAVPAAADESTYLQLLSDKDFYNRLGSQTLLAEGHKVCRLTASGMDSDSVIQVVQSDLAVSGYSAGFIVGAANSGLGC
jgi:hypothetical protein